jgi:hypothetical protein
MARTITIAKIYLFRFSKSGDPAVLLPDVRSFAAAQAAGRKLTKTKVNAEIQKFCKHNLRACEEIGLEQKPELHRCCA